jgi:hypothetical protein
MMAAAPESVVEDRMAVLFGWVCWLLAAGALMVAVITLVNLYAHHARMHDSPYRLPRLRRPRRRTRRPYHPGDAIDWAGLTAPLSAKDREWFVTYVFDPLSDKQSPPDDLTTK